VSAGAVHLAIADGVASVIFDRPEARNAMTWAMYDQLSRACADIDKNASVRVAVFRGAGACFVAGTDIEQFTTFAGPEAGIAYEARVEGCISALETLAVPTLAVIEGAAMGGGLVLAAACDLRIATPTARFGVPIARTVGNCLSIANVARLIAALGDARTRRLLLLAGFVDPAEALACGFLTELSQPESLEQRVAATVARLKEHAPITMSVSKEAIRRLRASGMPDDADLIAAAYGSDDFAEGAAAFAARRTPRWRGH
jgi:enoyl-CoA hydratase/carnithine racemase